MYTSSKTPFLRTFVKPVVFFWLLPVSTIFLSQCCKADQLSLLPASSASLAQVEWTSGPADASLGTLADIKISKGYRFTDATGARALLGKMNNPIPEGLVGILAPESGQWWVVLEYKDIGYVKDADKDKIDAAALLKIVSDRANRQNEERTIHGLSLVTSVDWKRSPVFEAKTHTVEWAILAKTQSGGVINHTMRLLGRQGVLDATAVEPYQAQAASDLVPLQELMKNISFKQGQRYTDYQKGDKISKIGLAGLIVGDDDSQVAQQNDTAPSAKSSGVWGWYVLAGVLAGGGVLLLIRGAGQQRGKAHHVHSASPVSNGIGNGHAHSYASVTLPVPAMPGNGSQPDKVKSEDLKPKAVITSNGSSKHRPSRRRRKIFDYHRFYVDTVMKLSSSGYTAEAPTSNGSNGRSNGHSFDRTIEGSRRHMQP